MKIRNIAVIFIVLMIAGCKGGNMMDKLIDARSSLKAVERPTKIDPTLTVEKAYQMQSELVGRLMKKEVLAGYKLSPKTVPNANDSKKMIPVYGYLFKSMVLPVGAIVKKKDFIDLHLENEVAFIIGKEILPKEIKTPADLKPYVKLVAPAIELPEIRYSGPIDDVTGIDLVVDNVVASKIIVGNGKPTNEVDADLVSVKMTRNGEVVNEGVSTMVEGSPWNSLFWLVKELEKKSETLKPDQIIMTGGIAKFMDSISGNYEATYTGLGKINFKVE